MYSLCIYRVADLAEGLGSDTLRFTGGDGSLGYGNIYLYRTDDPLPTVVGSSTIRRTVTAGRQDLGPYEFAQFGPAWVPDGAYLDLYYYQFSPDYSYHPQMWVFQTCEDDQLWFDDEPGYSSVYSYTGNQSYGATRITSHTYSSSYTPWDDVVMAPHYIAFYDDSDVWDATVSFEAYYYTPVYRFFGGLPISFDEDFDSSEYQYVGVDALCSGTDSVYQMYIGAKGSVWLVLVIVIVICAVIGALVAIVMSFSKRHKASKAKANTQTSADLEAHAMAAAIESDQMHTQGKGVAPMPTQPQQVANPLHASNMVPVPVSDPTVPYAPMPVPAPSPMPADMTAAMQPLVPMAPLAPMAPMAPVPYNSYGPVDMGGAPTQTEDPYAPEPVAPAAGIPMPIGMGDGYAPPAYLASPGSDMTSPYPAAPNV
ncbi:hypothetical protein KIPB_009211 [Kipferlia bialata]|uniref:Uncharacterized protein n=1 Tax=Kipferlia bialata TaxID=797122 RepID=A0A9K3D4Q3_9EUKA|nr:hypothetical protein KIPB_009211 [Kipferlia bialata]|eukprot:g9211.t1